MVVGASIRLGFASSAVSASSLVSVDPSSSTDSVLLTSATTSGIVRAGRAALNVSVAIALRAARSSPLATAAASLHGAGNSIATI